MSIISWFAPFLEDTIKEEKAEEPEYIQLDHDDSEPAHTPPSRYTSGVVQSLQSPPRANRLFQPEVFSTPKKSPIPPDSFPAWGSSETPAMYPNAYLAPNGVVWVPLSVQPQSHTRYRV